MATIYKEAEIARRRTLFGTQSETLVLYIDVVRGFVVDCKLEGDSRLVTFANGMAMREVIVAVDDKTRRHAWSARGEPLTHHNASIQVFAKGNDTGAGLSGLPM